MIAATFYRSRLIPGVRDVVLEQREQERTELSFPAVRLGVNLALQQVSKEPLHEIWRIS